MFVAIPDDAELNIIPAVSLACQTSFLFSVSVNDLTKTCSLIVLLDLVEIYLNVGCNSHSWRLNLIIKILKSCIEIYTPKPFL